MPRKPSCAIFSRLDIQHWKSHIWSVPLGQGHFIEHHLLFPCNMKWSNSHGHIWWQCVHVACGFGPISLCHFIFPCKPLSISPPLWFKGGRGFHFFFFHTNSSFRPFQETVVMVWLRTRSYTCIWIEKSLILIQWSTINFTISRSQDILLQIMMKAWHEFAQH